MAPQKTYNWLFRGCTVTILKPSMGVWDVYGGSVFRRNHLAA